MVASKKRIEKIKKQEIKANPDELGKRSVGSGSIGSPVSSMLNLLGARVLAFSHLNLMSFLSLLFFSLFLLFPSCFVKKEKEKIDFRTYLAEKQQRTFDLQEEMMKDPQLLEKMYDAFLKTGRMPIIYMELLTTTIVLGENSLIKPQHIKQVSMDGMIIPKEIDGIKIDVQPGDAFMGMAQSSALTLPEGMTLSIPMPENGKIPIFRAVEKVEELPDGTQKVYTRPATFPDVFKVLIIRNGDAILTGMKDELGVGDLVPDPELYSTPETPEEKTAKKIGEFLWEKVFSEELMEKMEEAKKEQGAPDEVISRHMKMAHMGFIEEMKNHWKKLSQEERNEFLQALTIIAKEKGIELDISKFFEEEQSTGGQPSPITPKSLHPMDNSNDPLASYYDWWAKLPLNFDVEAKAFNGNVTIGIFQHKERTPIYREVFRSFSIPPGDTKTPLSAHVGAVFFVKYAIDTYFINIPAFIEDLKEDIMTCGVLDKSSDECCIGKWHDASEHKFDTRCYGGANNKCTLGVGGNNWSFCLHYPSFSWCKDKSNCDKLGGKIDLGFLGEICVQLEVCWNPVESPTISRFPNFKKVGKLLGNFGGLVKELTVENTMFFGQAAAMAGAIGYLKWDSGNECFSSLKLEDVIFDKKIPISTVEDVGGGAPPFTPIAGYAPIISAECKFDFNLSLRDVICNIGINIDGQTISLCDRLKEKKVCTSDNEFINLLCLNSEYSDFMVKLSYADLLKRIKLSDLFGAGDVSFSIRIGRSKLAKVNLCSLFNRIFKENGIIEEDEDICELVQIIGDNGEQRHRSFSLFDILNFDVCTILPVACGKLKFPDLLGKLNLKDIRFGEEVELTFGELLDVIKKVKIKLPKIGMSGENELNNSSRALSILGIPVLLRVQITLQYQLGIEGMGSPKRGFWAIAGVQGGGGHIGAVAARQLADLLKGEMKNPSGGDLTGPTGETLPPGVTLGQFTMEWDKLLADTLKGDGNQSALAAVAVVSRCDEWTQFLKARLVTGAGLHPDEAKGIREAFFNEGYYLLARVGTSNDFHVIHNVLGSNDFEKIQKYHEDFDSVGLSYSSVITFANDSTKVCVEISGGQQWGGTGGENDPDSSSSNDKKIVMKVCEANGSVGSQCSCTGKEPWFTKTFYCPGGCNIQGNGNANPGGIVVFEYCGGFRGGQVYRPGILRIKDSFIRLVILPEASVAVDIMQFVIPVLGGPVITVKVQADAQAPIILSAELDSRNLDISPNGVHNYKNNLTSTKWKFSGPLYEIGDIPDVMKECTLTGSLTLQSDLIVDPKIILKTGGSSTDVPLPEIKIPILGMDFFDYLPRGVVLSFEKMGIYRVGECQKGRRNLRDCSLAGFYQCYEFCDHKDNDKDGIVDNNTGKTFSFLIGIANECPMVGGLVKYLESEEYYVDNDGDGFGSEPLRYACTWMDKIPPNAVQVAGDCDDNNPQINPIAQEICDCKDNNCNGQIDEGYNGGTVYLDCDGDGFGSFALTITNCCGLQSPQGCQWVDKGGDCNDNDCNISPIAVDIQGDGKDSNCDGQDGMAKTCYLQGNKLVCTNNKQQVNNNNTINNNGNVSSPQLSPKINTIEKLGSFIKKLFSYIFLPQQAYGVPPPCSCDLCSSSSSSGSTSCMIGSVNSTCAEFIAQGQCGCSCNLCSLYSNQGSAKCMIRPFKISCSQFLASGQCGGGGGGGMCSFLALCPDKDKDGFQDFSKKIVIGYYGDQPINQIPFFADYTQCSCNDCNDNDPNIPYPGIEVLDGKDNDCNGTVDDIGPKNLSLQCIRPTSTELTWEDETEGKDYFTIALLKPIAAFQVVVWRSKVKPSGITEVISQPSQEAVLAPRISSKSHNTGGISSPTNLNTPPYIPPSNINILISNDDSLDANNGSVDNMIQLHDLLREIYRRSPQWVPTYTRLDTDEFPDDISQVFCAKYWNSKIVVSPDEVLQDVVVSKEGNYVYIFKIVKKLYAPKNSGIVKKEVLCEDLRKKLCRGAPQCEIIPPHCREIEKLDGIINIHELSPEEDYFVTIWPENRIGNKGECSNIVKATTTTDFFDNATKVATGPIGTCVMRRAVKDWGDTNILYCIGDNSQGQIGDCSLVSGRAKPIRSMINVVNFDIGGEDILPISGIDSFEAYGHVCAIVEEYPDCSCNLCSSQGSEQKCMLGDETVNCSIWNKKFGQLCRSQTNTCSCDLCSKDPSKVCKSGSSQISCESWLKSEGAQCLPVCSCDLCSKEVAQRPEAILEMFQRAEAISDELLRVASGSTSNTNSCSYCRFGVNNEIMSCDMWVKKQKICDIPLCSCKLCVSKIKPDIMQVSDVKLSSPKLNYTQLNQTKAIKINALPINALPSNLFPVCRYTDVKGQEAVISCREWEGVKECQVNDYPACSCDFCSINTNSYCKDIGIKKADSIISCSSWLANKRCAKFSCGCEFCAAHSDTKCVDQNNREVLCKDWAQISCQVPCSCEFCSSNSGKNCSINGRTMICKEYASSDYCTKDIQSCSCSVCKSPDRLCEYKRDPKDPRGEIITCEKWMVDANPECALSCDCNLCGSNPQAVCKSGDKMLYCYKWQSGRGVKCCSCDVCSTGGETGCHYSGKDITCKEWSGQNFCYSSVDAGVPLRAPAVELYLPYIPQKIYRVHCWGNNRYGQVGAPITLNENITAPVPVTRGEVLAVATGARHTCAVMKVSSIRNRVICWGDNSAGQVHPTELTGFIVRPGRVWLDFSAPDSVKKIVAGGDFTCVLTTSGKVICWGANNVGQLGMPNPSTRGPVTVFSGGMIDVAAGMGHACAVRGSDLTIWCWGENRYGQLGLGYVNNFVAKPTKNQYLSGIVRVKAGSNHTCALTKDGAVWCWGDNWWGQLGDGSENKYSNIPQKVKLDNPVIDLAAGGAHTCAIDANRNVWCWGYNVAGQLGNYTNLRQNFPVKVKGAEASEYCRYYQTKSKFSCSDNDSDGSIGKVDATCKMRWEKLLVALKNPPLDLSSIPLNATAVRVISEDFGIDIPPAIASLDTPEKVTEASIGALSSLYSSLIQTYLTTYDYEEEVSYGNKVASTYPYAIIIDFNDNTSIDPKVKVPRFPEIITLVTPLVAKYYNNLVRVRGGDYSAPVTPSQCLAAQLDDCNDSAGQVTRYAWVDRDLDGYYGTLITGCVYSYIFPITYIPPSVLDCNDSNPSINPAFAEVCNGIDDNCNGQVDEGVTTTYYRDNDADGFGNPIPNADPTNPNPITICSTASPPPGYVSNNTDCNDNDPLINPNTRWYKDADGDGYTDGTYIVACIPPSGYVLSALPGDCDDNNPSIHPNTVWYRDHDRDGYTDGVTYVSCVQPPDYVLSAAAGDCDDFRPDVNSGQAEICDDVDQNCNGQYNEGIPCPLLQVVGWTAFSANLRWEDPFPSEQYFVVEVSTDTSFANTITQILLVGTGTTIASLDGTRTYFFRLKTIGSGNKLLGYSNVVSAPEFFADVLTVSAGANHTCAIKKDGSLWCWGWNGSGQLGLGDYAQRLIPEKVMALSTTPVVSVSAGDAHTCAVDQDKSLWCWGWNGSGQLGLGDTDTAQRLIPEKVMALSTTPVVSVSAGDFHTCAVGQDKSLWCWGENSGGQLGLGDTAQRLIPEKVMALSTTPVVSVSAGYAHTCAVDQDKSLWCWGENSGGQLGLGTERPSKVLYPVRVVKKFEGVMGAPAMKLGKDGIKGEYGEGNNNNNEGKSLAPRKYGCSSYGLVMFIPAFVFALIFSFARRKTFFSLLLLFVLSPLFFLFLISCAEGTKFDQLKIQVEKDKLVLGEPVKVTVNSVGGSKGKVKLDMGDGKEIEANIGESVTHTYSGVGLYEIRAYSKDFASDRKMVFVNDPPSISSLQVTDLQGNKVTTVDVGQPFLLVLDCKDITGVTKVIIDWGDGVKEEGKSCGIFTYSYRAEGQYNIKVEVQDEGYGGYFYSLKAEAQYQVNVENMVRKLPFVQIDLNTSVGEAPLQVTLTIFVNSYDKLTNLEISWGDGKKDTLNPADGVSRGGNFIFTASHTYNETGRYLIQVGVKDEKGREGFDFAGVLVAVSDPVISVRYKDTRGKVIEGNSASFLISDERFVAISGDISAADDTGFSVVSYAEYRSDGANYIVLQRESFFFNVSYTKSFGSCLLLENELICSSFGLPITSVTLPVDMSIRAIAVKDSVAIDNIDSVCDSNVCICSDLEGFTPLDVCRNIINNIENDPSASSGQSLSVNLR
jgi:alpha-tubulin suppressor-like RCC1 family protein